MVQSWSTSEYKGVDGAQSCSFQSRVSAEFAKVSVYFHKGLQLAVGQTAEKYCNDFTHPKFIG